MCVCACLYVFIRMHSLISANSCECVSVEIRGWLLGVILTLHHGFWAIRLRLIGLQNKQITQQSIS